MLSKATDNLLVTEESRDALLLALLIRRYMVGRNEAGYLLRIDNQTIFSEHRNG